MAVRGLSPATREALELLGAQIRTGRVRRGWTQSALAERVGVTKTTVINIERGSPSVSIGSVFEAATLTGVTLYDADPQTRAQLRALQRSELALLPEAVRERRVDDGF